VSRLYATRPSAPELLADTHARSIRRSEADFARVMPSTSTMCEPYRSGSHLGSQSLRIVDVRGRPN
jgi:hypothetical protein